MNAAERLGGDPGRTAGARFIDPDVLAIKQVTIGMPMPVVMATDGECAQYGLYAQAMLAGLYEQLPTAASRNGLAIGEAHRGAFASRE